MNYLSESQVRAVLVKNGIRLHDDSKLLLDLHQRIAHDLVDLYLATAKQQAVAPVMPAEQMGMF